MGEQHARVQPCLFCSRTLMNSDLLVVPWHHGCFQTQSSLRESPEKGPEKQRLYALPQVAQWVYDRHRPPSHSSGSPISQPPHHLHDICEGRMWAYPMIKCLRGKKAPTPQTAECPTLRPQPLIQRKALAGDQPHVKGWFMLVPDCPSPI